eukprot:scaffold1752_cov188-Amphora_coffeaeformis.AAC.4
MHIANYRGRDYFLDYTRHSIQYCGEFVGTAFSAQVIKQDLLGLTWVSTRQCDALKIAIGERRSIKDDKVVNGCRERKLTELCNDSGLN